VRSPGHWKTMKAIASNPKANPVAWATLVYSVTPLPNNSESRVPKALRATSQPREVISGIRAMMPGSSAIKVGSSNCSRSTVESTQKAITMRASETHRFNR
jgi:hypothetical protein